MPKTITIDPSGPTPTVEVVHGFLRRYSTTFRLTDIEPDPPVKKRQWIVRNFGESDPNPFDMEQPAQSLHFHSLAWVARIKPDPDGDGRYSLKIRVRQGATELHSLTYDQPANKGAVSRSGTLVFVTD